MFIFAKISHSGNIRPYNEDRLAYWKIGELRCLVMADGMGGLAQGGLAAEILLKKCHQIFHYLAKNRENPNEDIFRQIYQNTVAELNLFAEKQKIRMGTTAAIVFILPDQKIVYSWLGDSRIYHFRGKNFRLLTKDHTVAQQLADAGVIDFRVVKKHPSSHILTQALVSGYPVRQIEYGTLNLKEKDILLLCTDGLTNELSDEEIAYFLKGYIQKGQFSQKEINDLANQLLNEALSRLGRDNISLILVQCL